MIDEWFLTIYGGSIIVLVAIHWIGLHMYHLSHARPVYDRDEQEYYSNLADAAAVLGMIMILLALIGTVAFVISIIGGYFG